MPQHVHGVGADLDAGADLGELRGLLVDFDMMARLHQARRGGQPADPRPGNENAALLHREGSVPWLIGDDGGPPYHAASHRRLSAPITTTNRQAF